MKLFCVVLFLTIISESFAFSQEQMAIADKIANDCELETGVDHEHAKRLRADDFSIENDKLKCFAHCFVTKIGFIKDGKIDEVAIAEQLATVFPKQKTDILIDICRNLAGDNECEKAYNAYKCFTLRSAVIAQELSGKEL